MPVLVARICTWPGCSTIVARGRCAKHPYLDRSGPVNPKYLRKPWRELRAAHLRAHPMCVECFAIGRVTPAQAVDHKDGNSDNDAADNLQSLCLPCHARKTATQDGGFGNAGGKAREAIGVDGWPVTPQKAMG